MQAIAETLFDIVYLTTVITLGDPHDPWMQGRIAQFRLFGIMAVVLGAGDSFHLVPRAVALCTTGLENYTAALGIGKLDYLGDHDHLLCAALLCLAAALPYPGEERLLTAAVYGLAALRIILCLMPQNQWLSAESLPSPGASTAISPLPCWDW